MRKITISEFQAKMNKYLDGVEKGQELLILTGSKQKDFVILSIQHYNSITETLHLLSTPANANRLMESIKEHRDSIDDNQRTKETKKSSSQDSSH